jgi:Immunity protein 8
VKAKVRAFSSSLVEDFSSFVPERPGHFRFDLMLEVGVEGSIGRNYFGLSVCTPDWFRDNYLKYDYRDVGIVPGRHFLFVGHYDWPAIKAYIENYVESLETKTWAEMAEKIGRLAKYEDEDYEPPADLDDEVDDTAGTTPGVG